MKTNSPLYTAIGITTDHIVVFRAINLDGTPFWSRQRHKATATPIQEVALEWLEYMPRIQGQYVINEMRYMDLNDFDEEGVVLS